MLPELAFSGSGGAVVIGGMRALSTIRSHCGEDSLARSAKWTVPGYQTNVARLAALLVWMLVVWAIAMPPVPAEAQTYDAVHAFSREGGSPMSRLLVAPDGRLYGTTTAGGRYRLGSVFVLTPNGSGFDFANVWEFSGPDGLSPRAGLIRG